MAHSTIPETASSPAPSQATRPASQQSTCIITPVKTHGKYIPSQNTRRSHPKDKQQDSESDASLTQATPRRKNRKQVSSSSTHNLPRGSTAASKSKHKKHNKTTKNSNLDPNTSSEPDKDIDGMDLAQDSGKENKKAKKTQGARITEFDNIDLYFGPPQYGPEEKTKLATCASGDYGD
ncbi:hypothetical protein PtA15_3A5 [Puccinia triticina]|uniref:Hpc2-related domain-containing protein n=1 Tax=Puccinia triticina TaxID=208348 RepID=A0ABY7CDV8_9BASI|nr:uncharacterized protein PtA15_3A5 [Puccinia triticina]WAQ82642.1 hypothetical protein PtA15_3A5 [Puccinia triticina]